MAWKKPFLMKIEAGNKTILKRKDNIS